MAKSKNTIPAENIALYEKLVATLPKAELKGATMPYTSHNGHMFSFLDKDGNLSLRLPEEERTAFTNTHKTRLSEQHGVVLKEYVLVPAKLLQDTSTLKKYFAASFKYVSKLKPKPTKK
jgi:hypothetical protein